MSFESLDVDVADSLSHCCCNVSDDLANGDDDSSYLEQVDGIMAVVKIQSYSGLIESIRILGHAKAIADLCRTTSFDNHAIKLSRERKRGTKAFMTQYANEPRSDYRLKGYVAIKLMSLPYELCTDLDVVTVELLAK